MNKEQKPETTIECSQVGVEYIPVDAVIAIIKHIHLGHTWCNVCEAFDHECGCSPNVNEQYRNRIIDEIITFTNMM